MHGLGPGVNAGLLSLEGHAQKVWSLVLTGVQ